MGGAGRSGFLFLNIGCTMAIRVVIIEDQREIREMLAVLVNGSEGFCCVGTFEHAADALRDLPALNPDVALVDIHLPEGSGIDCVAALKTKCPSTQFVMCTSLDDTETIFSALQAGASGYLTKTTPPAKLLEAIAEVHQGGSPMSSQIARKVVASFQRAPQADTNLKSLSAREQEILLLLSKGLRYKEIAGKLFLSVETVRTHIRNIYEKLQVNSRTEAINKAFSR
jgi:DNA-binding NarL/FixJ family response regulator